MTALLAAFVVVVPLVSYVREHKPDDGWRRAGTAVPAGEPTETSSVPRELRRCSSQVARAVRNYARSVASSEEGRTADVSVAEVRSAWDSLVPSPGTAALATAAPERRTARTVLKVTVPVVAVVAYVISVLLIPALPLGGYGQAALILGALLLLYLPFTDSLPKIRSAWDRLELVRRKISRVVASLVKALSGMPGNVRDLLVSGAAKLISGAKTLLIGKGCDMTTPPKPNPAPS